MSSSIDDNIELITLNSPSSTKSYIKTKLKLKDNNVGSSPTSSPVHSDTKNETHNLFLARGRPPQSKPRPLPAPLKRHKRRPSRTTTEATSESQETPDSSRQKPSGDELTESIFSSRSDTRSQREKFRERFESVKKQAGRSVSKAHTFKTKAQNIRGLKRSITLMKRENEEIEGELRNYEKNKRASDDNGDTVSKIEAYKFFCEENEAMLDQENVLHSEHEDVNSFGKSTEVLIAVPEKDDGLDVQFLPADNLDFNIKLSETDQFWQASREPLGVLEKLETDEPRLLAKEGFFVNNKPNIPSSHLNILERRLLSVDDKKWFNCEGELEMLPDPYRRTSYRPHLYHEKNPHLEVEYVAPVIGPMLTENILVPHKNILDISILALKFKHHPLFSPEHVFEQKLITLYDAYKQKLNANKLERISKRLNALRSAKRNLETATSNSKTDLKKLNSYRDEIRKLRELHFEEGKQNRGILKAILQTWKAVKKIRQANTYSSTTTKLNIGKEKCSYEQEMPAWNAKIEEACNEIISELEFDFQRKMSDYKKQLEQWNQHVQDEEQIEEEIPKKPRKPLKNIDPEVIVQEMVDKFRGSFKPPGEPILHFSLSYDTEVTDKIENPKEKLRRNAVATTKVYLRVLCNKIEVCKSKTVSLSEKFTCMLDEAFSIQLSVIPEHLVVEIHEQPSTLMKRKLGEVKITIPSKNVTMGQNKTAEQYFEKEEIVHYKHVGVGSGIQLKNIFPGTNEESEDVLYTSGVLTCKVGWDLNHFNAKTFEESEGNDVLRSVLNEDGTIDMNKLVEWANENNPDPQDPKNSVLHEYIKNYDQDFGAVPTATKAYFRFSPGMAPFEFCDPKDIEEKLRFQILELRNRNEPEFVGMLVPNRLKEIPLDALADYKRRQGEQSKSLMEDDDGYDEDELDSKRTHGRKYLKQVYTKVFQQCRNTNNNLVYEDVVNEKIISYIENLTRNILSSIFSWFQFQPRMNILTAKTTRKSSEKMTDLNAPVKITITIKSAVNVPLRSTPKTASTSRSNVDTNAEEDVVKPFVVVTYQNTNLSTLSVEGTDPIWNEELVLPLESTNTDYLSPNALSGSLVIRLFDEIIVKGRNGEVTGKNYLGLIEIPVSAVVYNNKMEGLFKLQKAANLFGYEQDNDNNSSHSTINNVHQVGVKCTYLSLKVTLQPHIPKLTQSMDELETTELPYIKQHILNWNEAYNNDYPNRKFSAFAIDINGKTTCVTRYIRPLEPPQLNIDSFDVSPEQCARYISMIPFTDSNKFYQNVWLSTEQLLKLMIGSVVDHAIALTCYLTSLDIEAWLLLGYGLPHGSTAYVLAREYAREPQIPLHFIYDVVTAAKYDIMDTFCPLQKIFCVINKQNVWANIQRTDQIQLTRFDVMRRSDWLPLFTGQMTAPTNSAQQKLIYSVTPDVKPLEIRIDKKIRKKLAKLRTHERTVWNHQLSRAFKTAIARCETNCMHGRGHSELFSDIKNFTLSHSVNGYIVNIPYTSISTILAAVVSTGIHLHEAVDTEFGLAIQIYSYPNHVLAVWICLAAITRK